MPDPAVKPAPVALANTSDATSARVLKRVLAITMPLALMVCALLPNAGPVFRVFSIPAASMAPGLPVGSHVLVSRASYGYARHSFDWIDLPIAGRWPDALPKRGDVVVFRLPKDRVTIHIKRVIGLPGDRVQMKNGRLVLNGTTAGRDKAADVGDPGGGRGTVAAYTEHLAAGSVYTIIESALDTGPLDTTGVYTVPAEHLFLMGDNRDNSNDSRGENGIGFVPIELLIGRVVASF
jgi:signal peptidase I